MKMMDDDDDIKMKLGFVHKTNYYKTNKIHLILGLNALSFSWNVSTVINFDQFIVNGIHIINRMILGDLK